METIRISVMVSIVFFQQGNDNHTVLHIIDNIELKLDCKVKNRKSNHNCNICPKKKIAIRYFHK